MKMKLLSALFILFGTVSYGQTKIYVPGGTTTGVLNNTTNSNIGIGTSSPSATLHVAGNLKTTAQINAAEYITVDKNGSYRVGMNGHADGYIVGRNDLLEQKFVITSNGNSYFTGGNVGIGTISPDATLTVKGDIHTREVKVDLNGAVAPDYVFADDYSLQSLQEIKSFININHHLPNIPSAKEMEENGIELKEMNLKLLEKVEELTLHLIDQSQQIMEQQEKIVSQADELEQLKAVVQVMEMKIEMLETNQSEK